MSKDLKYILRYFKIKFTTSKCIPNALGTKVFVKHYLLCRVRRGKILRLVNESYTLLDSLWYCFEGQYE